MVSDEALLDLSRALVSAVRSGLPLSDAFKTLASSRRHGRLLAGAAELTAGGTSLHEAFAARRAFPPLFIALLRAGEEGGKTEEFLELYADCLEARLKFRRQLERMLVYPLAATVLAAGLFLLVSFKVMPLVMEPLLKSGAELPPQAFLFASLAEWLAESWPKLLGIGALALLALRAFFISSAGRKARGLAGHWLPVCRYATAELRLYYLYTTIALLMKAGLRPGALMDVLLQFSEDDLVTKGRLKLAAAELAGGTGFARSVAAVMQKDDRTAAELAEKAGRLDDTLLSRARLHYDRHLHRMDMLLKAFNLSTLAAIAAVCFGLILTVIWPAVSALGGAKDPLKALRPEPAPAASQRALTPEEENTAAFNSVQGKRVAGMMSGGRTASGESGPGDGKAGKDRKKKLAPVVPIKSVSFGGSGPAGISPTDTGGR
ncbi:MAG: type II secretion system F family protein [Elusimicrobia bacterium]|nr:type II secretion system F family protein [Elusimicrobiota bacterium]